MILCSASFRESSTEEFSVFKMNTATYGTKPAAFLAIRAMHQLSYDEEESLPIGAKIVRRDFYVDDLISGGDSVEEVREIRLQVKELLSRGHFPIRSPGREVELIVNAKEAIDFDLWL